MSRFILTGKKSNVLEHFTGPSSGTASLIESIYYSNSELASVNLYFPFSVIVLFCPLKAPPRISSYSSMQYICGFNDIQWGMLIQ